MDSDAMIQSTPPTTTWEHASRSRTLLVKTIPLCTTDPSNKRYTTMSIRYCTAHPKYIGYSESAGKLVSPPASPCIRLPSKSSVLARPTGLSLGLLPRLTLFFLLPTAHSPLPLPSPLPAPSPPCRAAAAAATTAAAAPPIPTAPIPQALPPNPRQPFISNGRFSLPLDSVRRCHLPASAGALRLSSPATNNSSIHAAARSISFHALGNTLGSCRNPWLIPRISTISATSFSQNPVDTPISSRYSSLVPRLACGAALARRRRPANMTMWSTSGSRSPVRK
ncbi:hypothetical protein VTI74DRAFT_9018 [Chaetomium olivicolor]